MLSLDDIILMVVTGGCMGFGNAIGTYFANRSFLKHLDKKREGKN